MWNMGTCRFDDKGESASERNTRLRVAMQSTGAEQFVVVMKVL